MQHLLNLFGSYLVLFIALRMIAPDVADALARYGKPVAAPFILLLCLGALTDAVGHGELATHDDEVAWCLGYAAVSALGYAAWRHRRPAERGPRRLSERRREDGTRGAPGREP
jgi:hypothetical protein